MSLINVVAVIVILCILNILIIPIQTVKTMKRQTLFFLLLAAIGISLAFVFQTMLSGRAPLSGDTTRSNAYPARVICAAPSLVECMYALGLEDRIVGISDFATYPPQVVDKERIGGYVNPNFEKMMALQPDLIMIQGRMDKHSDFAAEKGIPFERYEMSDIEVIGGDILRMGKTFGVEGRADTMVKELRDGFAEVRAKAAQINVRPKVFLCMGRKPGSLSGLFTMGPKTFIGELLTIAGGENIFEDVTGGYPQISKESLLKREPDVIIEMYLGGETPEGGAPSIVRDWQQMPSLPAVASGRVHLVTEDYMVMPGPRMLLAARTFFDLIHSEGTSAKQ